MDHGVLEYLEGRRGQRQSSGIIHCGSGGEFSAVRLTPEEMPQQSVATASAFHQPPGVQFRAGQLTSGELRGEIPTVEQRREPCSAVGSGAFWRWIVKRRMAHDLESVGITANCVPVLDLPRENTTAAITSRAYAAQPEVALLLARSHVDGFMEGGVLPVMKHIPGHGRAEVDSHYELPVIKAARAELEAHDFLPFSGYADCPMAMTAHVVLTAIDPDHPATQSKRVIHDVIRSSTSIRSGSWCSSWYAPGHVR